MDRSVLQVPGSFFWMHGVGVFLGPRLGLRLSRKENVAYGNEGVEDECCMALGLLGSVIWGPCGGHGIRVDGLTGHC